MLYNILSKNVVSEYSDLQNINLFHEFIQKNDVLCTIMGYFWLFGQDNGDEHNIVFHKMLSKTSM